MLTDPATGGSAAAGAVVADRYRLEEPVGRGGSATVWRAVHLELNRPVALKFLALTGADPTMVRERFLREARIAAAVRHRNVVDITDFGTDADGRPFMVMELLEGESLASRMARDPTFAIPDVVRIGARALSGLGAVHDAGIVHRDLKPENVFLVRDADGLYPKLLDFGISRSIQEDLESVVPTRDNVLTGTPQYMSPEQARGVSDIDGRSDLWAMGVILYEMLTETLPYDDENPGDLIVKILTGDPAPLEDLRPEASGAIATVVQRALARSRDDRFQSAREMRQALLDAATRTAAALTTSADSSLAEHDALRPNELMEAVGSSYEPGDSAVMSLADPAFADTRAEMATAKIQRASGTDRRSRAGLIALGAAALIGGGLVLALSLQPSGGEVSAESLPSIDGPAGDAQTSVVTLRRLPAEAAVTVDGRPVRGAVLEIPRDGMEHVIEVNVPGFEPWQIRHEADGHRAYEVDLVPLALERAEPAPPPSPRVRPNELIRNPGF